MVIFWFARVGLTFMAVVGSVLSLVGARKRRAGASTGHPVP